MDKKKIVKITLIIISILILLLLIFFGAQHIYQKSENVKRKHNQKIELINSSYAQFSNLVNDFNLKREELSTYIDTEMYYENFDNIKDNLYNFYLDYDKIVGSINTLSLSLSKSCNIDFVNNDIEKKCSSYQDAYEMIVNIYINDIKMYNEQVKKYNEWKKTESAKEFKSEYVSDYVDLNKDGVYTGKDDEDE